jgi:hypothetical protein
MMLAGTLKVGEIKNEKRELVKVVLAGEATFAGIELYE